MRPRSPVFTGRWKEMIQKMSDSGEQFFRADKPNRNAAFSFKNQTPGNPDQLADEVAAGDQSVRVHPFPEMLGPQNGQKVGNPMMEPSPESAADEAAGRTGDGPRNDPINGGTMPLLRSENLAGTRRR